MKTTLNKLAIAEFAKDEGLELLSEYAELREKGLRKQALKKIREFVEGTKDYDDEKKRQIVRRIEPPTVSETVGGE